MKYTELFLLYIERLTKELNQYHHIIDKKLVQAKNNIFIEVNPCKSFFFLTLLK
jgi:hypothetical protein